MKHLRQLCAGLILTFALTSTVFAGQMDCPGVTQPPPEETSATQSDSQTNSTITEALLVLIEGVLLVP